MNTTYSSSRGRRLLIGAAVCFTLGLSVRLRSEEPDETDAKNKRIQAMIEESVGWYELLPHAESKTAIGPQIVIRWQNASRGRQGEDLMVFWMHDGRPVAAASVFPWGGSLCHEFVSLSREAKLIAREGPQVVWSPSEAGVEFQAVPEAAAPSETLAGRMRDMKALARQFTVTMTGWKGDDSDREQMRMLPRAVYRHEIEKAKATHPDLLDGAAFAFVQGTDPEALLLLEAVRHEGAARWEYAFARATSGGLEARHADNVVWTAEKYANSNSDIHKPQTMVRKPLGE